MLTQFGHFPHRLFELFQLCRQCLDSQFVGRKAIFQALDLGFRHPSKRLQLRLCALASNLDFFRFMTRSNS